jgi:hypothetical protein
MSTLTSRSISVLAEKADSEKENQIADSINATLIIISL